MKKIGKNSLVNGMRHAILIPCFILMVCGFAGCNDKTSVSVNMGNSANIHNTALGTESLIEIGEDLWYDSTTRIVYWWNGRLDYGFYGAVAPSPYYAPNGLPYKYNPETNTFEEIDNCCQNECCLQKGEFSE